MKTSVLKASKELANQVSADLLSKTVVSQKTGKTLNVFCRNEIENGFEIITRGKHKETGEQVVVFRYVNDNGRKSIQYDENLLSF